MTWGEKKPDDRVEHTTINGCHHLRLFNPDGVLIDEMACEDKRDLPFIGRTLLRWRDKLGGGGKYADRARHRQKEGHGSDGMHGRIWYKCNLDEERRDHLVHTMDNEKALRYLEDTDPVRQEAARMFLQQNNKETLL